MTDPGRKLVVVYSGRYKKRLVFEYEEGRFNVFESFQPSSIAEALQVSLERIEEAYPGSIEKAARSHVVIRLFGGDRTLRWIAKRTDPLVPNNPYSSEKRLEVAGCGVSTNIAWVDIPEVLKVVCKAAGIKYGSLADIAVW